MSQETKTIRMIATGGRAPGRKFLIGERFTDKLQGGDYMFALDQPVEILAVDLPFFMADEHAQLRGRRQFEEVIEDQPAGETAPANTAATEGDSSAAANQPGAPAAQGAGTAATDSGSESDSASAGASEGANASKSGAQAGRTKTSGAAGKAPKG